MELRSRSILRRPAGGEHKPTTLIRLIYRVEESARRLWIVDLPWFCGTSEAYRVRAEDRACLKFRRTYGHDLAPERIARMWNDYNDFRKEMNHE